MRMVIGEALWWLAKVSLAVSDAAAQVHDWCLAGSAYADLPNTSVDVEYRDEP